ncbi:MAG: phosphoglucosamine mutase [Pirellulales bacterium]|nr:phosphoglucosamine mutase [Pirellulales bacterium]
MSEPIISVSGLRGIVGDSLTAEVAVRYAAAFSSTLPPGSIVLTYDGRSSGPNFLTAIREGLSALGREVVDAGVAATPTTGVLVKQMRSPAGGIQISASHNPPQYNGMKLFSAEGRVIPAIAGAEVMKRYRGELPEIRSCTARGVIHRLAKTAARHVELVLSTVNVESIRRRNFRVLLDANHGSGSVVGKLLLEHLNCQANVLGGAPDGQFAHPPEPTAENLTSVLRSVTENQCAIGFCQDPDADRLAVIDENGRYLGEEYTLAICVNHVLSKSPGPVVTNCSTSRMTEDLAKKYNVSFFRSAVGEANVVDAMLQYNALIGGEGNGGVIDPRVVLVRDSFTAMALILDAMAERDLPASALADELPRYKICKTKIDLPREKLAAGYEALERHFVEAKPDRLDGLRLDWPDQWLLVRGSNTEPIVRAIAEAPTMDGAQDLCMVAAGILKSI